MHTIHHEAHREIAGTHYGTGTVHYGSQNIMDYLREENMRVLKQIYGEELVERFRLGGAGKEHRP